MGRVLGKEGGPFAITQTDGVLRLCKGARTRIENERKGEAKRTDMIAAGPGGNNSNGVLGDSAAKGGTNNKRSSSTNSYPSTATAAGPEGESSTGVVAGLLETGGMTSGILGRSFFFASSTAFGSLTIKPISNINTNTHIAPRNSGARFFFFLRRRTGREGGRSFASSIAADDGKDDGGAPGSTAATLTSVSETTVA